MAGCAYRVRRGDRPSVIRNVRGNHHLSLALQSRPRPAVRATQSRSSVQRAFLVASSAATGFEVEVLRDGVAGIVVLAWACQLAPGFAVGGVDTFAGAIVGKDVDACAAGEGFDRDDDQGVFGKDVADVRFRRRCRGSTCRSSSAVW